MSWERLPMPKDGGQSIFTEFKAKARFLVDESLGEGTVQALRDLKLNVKGVWDVGLVGRPDEDVFAFARRDRRILLSHDTDFLDDRRFPLRSQFGVIVLPGGSGDTDALVEAFRRVVTVFVALPELCRNAKIHTHKGKVFDLRSRDYDTGKVTTRRYKVGDHSDAYIWRER
jgi:predicted nuclease of predicted toxin-antitoxin system